MGARGVKEFIELEKLGVLMFVYHKNFGFSNKYILLDVLVHNIIVSFYEFCSILTSPQGESKYKERVKIYSDIVH